MQFTRLRVRGFKSFGDEVDLPIGEGLTGIVGPNGCGKSNVVEALRWVMGESSARDLRGGEMDDVLFGGSALRPAFDVAEVALMVNQPPMSDQTEPEFGNVYGLAEARAQNWGSDLEISRRIERGHGSTYRINNREVRARDVQLIFADAAAGSRSPAIISQGKVTTIIEAKPEERRRLLEDAAGIGGLHSRRREAELKLNATQANLERVSDRLGDLERDLSGLQRQARDAERYRKLSEEIRYFEQLLLLARVIDAETSLDQAIHKQEEATSKCKQANSKLDETTIDLAGIAREMPDVQAAITRLSARIAGGRERLSSLEASAQAYERDVARIQTAIVERKAEAEGLAQDLQTRQTQLPAKQQELAQSQITSQSLFEQAPALKDHLANLQAQESEARQALQNAQTRLATMQAERNAINRQIQSLTDREQSIQAELKRALEVDDDALVKVAERQLSEAKARFDESIAQAQSAQTKLDAIHAQEAEQRASIEMRRKASSEAADHWQSLENERLRSQAMLDAFAHENVDLRNRLARAQKDSQRLAGELASFDLPGLTQYLEELDEKRTTLGKQLNELKAESERALLHESDTKAERAKLREALDLETGKVQSLKTEAEALAAVHADDDPDPILSNLVIEEGYEAALSAALGDDLLSGKSTEQPRYWQEIEAGMLPAWPTKLPTLDCFVRGEAALTLRLSMIAICENEQDAKALQYSLQPGQRLVTKDGGLWRWDGYVQKAAATKGAEKRVHQRRRQAELKSLLPRLEMSLSSREADLAAAEAAQTAAILVAQESKRALATQERQIDEIEREQDRQRANLEDAKARSDRLEIESSRIDNEKLDIETKLQALSMPGGIDPNELDANAKQALLRKQDLAKELENLLAQQTETSQLLEQERNRAASIANTVENARSGVTQAESLFERRRGEAEGRRQSRDQAVAGLNRDLEQVQSELATAQNQLAALGAAFDELQTQIQNDSQHHQSQETQLEQARLAVSDNAGQAGRLHERITSLTRECERMAQETVQLQNAYDQAQTRLNAAMSERETILSNSIEGAEATVAAETLCHQLASEARELAEFQDRHQKLEARQSEASMRKEKAAEDAIRAREQLAAGQAEVAQFEATLKEHMAIAERGIDQSPQSLLENPHIRTALTTHSARQIETQLEAFKGKRERMGAVNLRAAAEIDERQKDFNHLKSEEADLREAHERLTVAISELDKEAKKRLIVAFDKVDEHFRRLFAKLFGGGKAHLRLTNIDVPGKAGLELDAMPPGKKLQNISLLSGGEKGLTALALVFALFLSQPSPLCILDEVDAALDDANVERFVELMVDIARSTGTRFIVVTHHPLTMARMDRLFGVTMIERGVSRLVSVTLSTAIDIRSSA